MGQYNIKIARYQYWKSHCKDGTVLQWSYIYNKNVHIWKDGLYIETGS